MGNLSRRRSGVGAATQMLGVIGDPIAHSLSPRLQAKMLRHWGLDACYLAFRVAAGDLAAALGGMRALGIRGLNVTAPHKRAVIDHLDALEGDARDLRAVNAVRLDAERGLLHGTNTDARGLELALRAAGRERPWNRSSRFAGSAWILGAGGAGRAAVLALARLGFKRIHILARREGQASDVVKNLASRVPVAELRAGVLPRTGGPSGLARLRLPTDDPDLVVQATSCGLGAQARLSPWPDGLALPARAAALDLVYGALPTPFLKQAKAAPWQADGLSMLVWQGALALQYFLDAPLPSVRTARGWERSLRRAAVADSAATGL